MIASCSHGRRGSGVGHSVVAAAFALIVLPACAAGQAVPAPGGDSAVDRLTWLAGCWEGVLANGATYEEMWLEPRGGMMLGMARMTRDGRTLSFEFMQIVGDGAVPVYAAQPSGRAATLFSATAVHADAVTFENAGHDFPQRIRYRRVEPDGLHATIDGQVQGQERALEFPLGRTVCPGT
jgi:hypothetical protein